MSPNSSDPSNTKKDPDNVNNPYGNGATQGPHQRPDAGNLRGLGAKCWYRLNRSADYSSPPTTDPDFFKPS